jgi:hypothetical protein
MDNRNGGKKKVLHAMKSHNETTNSHNETSNNHNEAGNNQIETNNKKEVIKKRKKRMKLSDKLTSLYIIVTTVIMVYTIQAVNLTKEALNESKKSSHKSDSLSDVRDIRSIIRDSINKEFLKTSEKSANAAENSFFATKNQFEKDNEPYLLFQDSISSNGKDTAIISYRYMNNGRVPTLVIEGCFRMIRRPGKDIPKMKDFVKGYRPVHVNTMAPPNKQIVLLKTDTLVEGDFINAKNMYIYIGGYFKYKNLITKKINRYEFIIKVINLNSRIYEKQEYSN